MSVISQYKYDVGFSKYCVMIFVICCYFVISVICSWKILSANSDYGYCLYDRFQRIGAIHLASTISVWRIRMNCIPSYWGNDWQKRGRRSCGIQHIGKSWRNVCRMLSSLKQNAQNSRLRWFNYP